MGIYDMPPRAEGHSIEAASESPCRFLVVSRITVAKAGKRHNKTKNMDKTHKIEPRQREALVDLLREAKREKSSELEASSGISEEAVVRELALEAGADKIMAEMEELYPQIKALEARQGTLDNDLQKLGFRWENSSFRLNYGGSYELHEKVRQTLKEKRQPIEKSLKKYDLAIADIWTVDTNADASKAIEGLI